MPNEPFLHEVLGFIETHPEQWDQTAWVDGYWGDFCGTVGCLAGWAYLLGTPSPQPQPSAREVYAVAQALLGLTDHQALTLFSFTATVEPGPANNGLGIVRLPTFAELLVQVEAITGVRYKAADRADTPHAG